MKPHFDFGWFKGEEFSVLKISIGDVYKDYEDKVSMVVLFQIKIAKFVAGIYLGY